MFAKLWSNCLKHLRRGKAERLSDHGKRRGGAFRPQVEYLEDRLTPAMLFVNTHADPANPTHGVLSLREAIMEANAAKTPDTIVLSTGTYRSAMGEFDITSAMTIEGQGADMTTLDGGGPNRIFNVLGTINVTFADMRMRHGGTTQLDGGAIQALTASIRVVNCALSDNIGLQGGAINDQNGNVTLIGSTVARNVAQDGGGGIYTGGMLVLNNSVVRVNSTQSDGGGIFDPGTVTLTGSTVSGNQSGTSGGGIAAATVNLMGSTVAGNTTGGFGGGILASTAVNLTDSTVSGNFAGTFGGGIDDLATATLSGSTVSGNSAGKNGGGINTLNLVATDSTVSYNHASQVGGGIEAAGATLTGCACNDNSAPTGGGIDGASVTCVKSTISGNYASGGAGGAISAEMATLFRSTISGNVAAGNGGGINASIAGLSNCTVSGNSAFGSGGGIIANDGVLLFDTIAENRASAGGGVFTLGQHNTSSVQDTIIALNLVSFGGSGPDVSGGFTDLGNNLIGIFDGSVASGFSIGNGVGSPTNPLLPGLTGFGDHGGPTQTYALLPGSKAAGAGVNVALATLPAALTAQATTLTLDISNSIYGSEFFVPGLLLRLGSEVVRVTAVKYLQQDVALTLQRGVDGTHASDHPSGSLFIATDQRGVLRPATGSVDIGAFD